MKNKSRYAVLLALIPALLMFTTLTEAQERKRPAFTDLDANQDGKLSLEEFSTIGSRRATPEKMFKRLDSNNDGYVTEDEFKAKKRGGRRGS